MIFDSFERVIKTSQQARPDNYPEKYTRCKTLYRDMRKILKKVARGGYKRGLDVGCAHGSLTILAPEFGMEIVGLDIRQSAYMSSQQKLQEMGYPVVLYSSLPLSMFEDNEFEFIVMKRAKCYYIKEEERIAELARILKDSGTWHGSSPNIVLAAKAAKQAGGNVILFTSRKCVELIKHVNAAFVVDATSSDIVQECHQFVYHLLCDCIESGL